MQAEFSVKKAQWDNEKASADKLSDYVKKSTKLKMRKRLLIVIRISQKYSEIEK